MKNRLPDWQSRLADCLAERRSRAFCWGSHDCVLFAADCVKAVTGNDPAADVRGGYHGEKAALRMLKTHGGIRALASRHLGEEIAPLFAQLGDIGVVMTETGEGFAVCGGSSWLAPAAEGLTAYPLDAALTAWRVC